MSVWDTRRPSQSRVSPHVLFFHGLSLSASLTLACDAAMWAAPLFRCVWDLICSFKYLFGVKVMDLDGFPPLAPVPSQERGCDHLTEPPICCGGSIRGASLTLICNAAAVCAAPLLR